jgi:outer membrane receptor protein involved in Fe transport
MRGPILLFLLLLGVTTSYAQGTFRGKVTDPNGEAVMEVKILLLENKAVITKTDLDGNFTLNIPDNALYKVRFTHYAHDTLIESIQIKDKEVLVKNITINPRNTTKNEKQITVGIKQTKANDYYMEKIKLNSATTIDYISSETMKKTGDANVTAAVARVSGVSTNGGLITVRGIGDRYVKTTLNGSRIPTLDPLTNNIKLDIFPSSLVDNIIITKTASPDLPGDWAGAYISVETKDFPDRLTVNVESSFGYNAQTTFKDFITSDRSETDWLGFDGGLRNRDDRNEQIVQPILNPSNYQEMVALGLGDYFKSIGVTGWKDGSSEESTYMRLGLVQLGLLAAGQLNDNAAFQTALNTYNVQYAAQAFDIINPNGTSYINGFANNWNTTYRKAPLNFTQNFSVGDQVKLFGKPLGYFFGLRYGSSVRFDPNGISQRILPEELDYAWEYTDEANISRQTNSWSMLLNLAYKLNDFNKLSFLIMPNITGTNDVANFSTQWNLAIDAEEINVRKNIFYEQREQKIYQFASQHVLPKSKLKLDINASFTDGQSTAPDFKLTKYVAFRQGNEITPGFQFSPNADDGIRRYYRYLDEDLLDTRFQLEVPLAKEALKLVRKLKLGGAYQLTKRNSSMEEYFLTSGNAILPALQNDDINAYLSDDKFTITNGQLGFFYDQRKWDWNYTFGQTVISSTFALVDFEFTKNLRFNGGLRVEKVDLLSDVNKYHLLGYNSNDARRFNSAGFPLINPGILDQINLLPSGSLIYKLANKKNTTNLRLNFSQTVARPNLREMSGAAIYDNEFRTLIYGNPNLKIVEIMNYDFRFENYFKGGDNISVSAFYKDFTNHIEMGFGAAGITWDNNQNSYVAGLEIEGKKEIGKHFEFRSNVTLVKSYSQFIRKDLIILPNNQSLYIPIDTVERTMFGQAPYIVNGILSYTSDTLGFTATVSYNVQGPRLVLTGILKGRPDVYEMPRHTVDMKVSKTLSKHFAMSVTVRDLLNAPVLRAYKTPMGYIDFDRFRYGTNYQLGISYKL